MQFYELSQEYLHTSLFICSLPGSIYQLKKRKPKDVCVWNLYVSIQYDGVFLPLSLKYLLCLSRLLERLSELVKYFNFPPPCILFCFAPKIFEVAILLPCIHLLIDGIHANVSILIQKMISCARVIKRKWNLAVCFWICSTEQQLYDIERTEGF